MKKTSQEDKRNVYLSTTKAAALLGCSHATMVVWCKNGKVKAIKPGRNWRVPSYEIDRLLEGK